MAEDAQYLPCPECGGSTMVAKSPADFVESGDVAFRQRKCKRCKWTGVTCEMILPGVMQNKRAVKAYMP